jgi:hypothetical protein
MTFRHHRTLGVESFEDRVLPSSLGVFDFTPAVTGPARAPGPERPEPVDVGHGGPGVVDLGRDHDIFPGAPPSGFPGAPPIDNVIIVITAPDRGGPQTRELPLPDPLPPAVTEHFEEVGRPIVATPAGLAVVLPARFVSTLEVRQFLSPQLGEQPGAPATAEAARTTNLPATPATAAPPGATVNVVSSVSAGNFLPAATTTEPTGPGPTATTPPIVPDPGAPPVVVDAADPIEVDVPGGVPLAGLFGLDTAALEGQARQLLARVTDLAAGLPENLGGPEGSTWLVSAAVLTGGVGYALWANGSRRRTARVAVGPDSVLARWGEEHDSRLR